MSIEIANQEPLVSVCIPTYNRSGRMRRAVEALIQGEYRNLEILISDNGSQDDTQAVGEALARQYGQVRYMRHDVNMGPVWNFEFVRGQANGKYFLWHGDDDYLGPDFIKACVEALERDDSLVLASGLAAYHYLGAPEITHYGNVIQPGSRSPLARVVTYLWNVQENSIFCGAYRIDRVKGGMMPNCLAGDWIWMTHVLLQGRALVIPTVYVHRDYGDSTSVSYRRVVEVQRLPAWNARFPWLAKIVSFMHYLKLMQGHSNTGSVRMVRLVVAAVLAARAMRYYAAPILRRMPGVRRIYRAVRQRFLQ